MGSTVRSIVPRLGTFCRAGAVAVIAGFYRSRSVSDVNERIAARPIADQVTIVLAVLAGLLTLSVFAAQFGWLGMLLFWLGVILVVN